MFYPRPAFFPALSSNYPLIYHSFNAFSGGPTTISEITVLSATDPRPTEASVLLSIYATARSSESDDHSHELREIHTLNFTSLSSRSDERNLV